MKARAHCVYSNNEDMPVQWFDKFDKQAIKQAIIKKLEQDPTDTIEHCREYSKQDLKRFAGMEIINLYEVNPKNGKPSLIVTRANQTFYKSLI